MNRVVHIVAVTVACAVVLTATPPLLAHPEIAEQIRAITEVMQRQPNDASLFLRRGELHRIHRDWDAAERDYARARALDPELAAVLLALGHMRLDAGRPGEAAEALRTFVERRPESVDGMVLLGRALAAGGEPLAAAGWLDRAVAASETPAGPDVYVSRARAYADSGPEYLDRAIAGLDDGLARLGSPITLQLEAVELELRRGTADGALARLDRIAATTPRKETWLVRRAEILRSIGRYDEARDAYLAALAAIDTLPASRRATRAMDRLTNDAREALSQLEESHGVAAVR